MRPVPDLPPDPDTIDPALRLALSEALIAPGERCIRLGPDNQPLRNADGTPVRVTVADAVAQNLVAMAIPAPDVLAVDHDHADSDIQVERFETLRKELANRGYVPLVLNSGRPGHKHLFCVCETVGARNDLAALAKILEFDVRQSIRLPLSPHRLGLPVSLASPATAEAALRAVRRNGPVPVLAEPAPQATVLRLVRPGTDRVALPDRAMTALSHGHRAAGYSSRHGACLGVAQLAGRAGWTPQALLVLLKDPAYASSDVALKFAEKGPDWFLDTWQKAQETAWAVVTDPTEVQPVLDGYIEQALSQPWLRAVDLALYVVIAQAGRTATWPTMTPVLSQLTMAAGIGDWEKTAVRARKRLEAAGAIRLHKKGEWNGQTRRWAANQWRVCSPPLTGVVTPYLEPTGGQFYRGVTGPVYLAPAHDVFSTSGLRHTGWQLLSVLGPEDPQTAVELARGTGRNEKTVRGYLTQFVHLDLARPFADGYVRSQRLDLDAAARRLGVTGAAARRLAEGVAKKERRDAHKADRHRAVAKVVGFDTTTGEVLHHPN